MNLNDETIRKVMAETMSRTLDQMILSIFLSNAHKSPGGVEWVSFKCGEAQGTYADTLDTEPSDIVWRTEYIADYTIPANSLVIEGQCQEVINGNKQ